jgi:hypothetical protein
MMHKKAIVGFLMLVVAVLVSAPAVSQVKDYRDIDYPELPEFEIPRPEVFTLENGMKVFLMEDHELPLISVRARIRTGSNHMPAEKEGLGQILGQVQREGGTKSMTGDEMDDFLEARAAFVETGMGGDSAFASMNCLKDDFDDVLAVFHDVLRYPAFAEDKIELASVQLNTSIARRNDNIGDIVGREFQRLIYGADSPLTRLTEYATVAAVTRDDLLAWHAKHYHPNNIYLGVTGDFDSKQMKEKIKNAFASWPKGPAFAEGEVPYQKDVQPGVYFIEKEDVTQAFIRTGHLGIKRDNPDYYAVVVMTPSAEHPIGEGAGLQRLRRDRCVVPATGSLPGRYVHQVVDHVRVGRRGEGRDRGDDREPTDPGGDESSQGGDSQFLRLQLHLAWTDSGPADDVRLLRPSRGLPGAVPRQHREGQGGGCRPRGQEIPVSRKAGAAGRGQVRGV